MAQKSDGQKKGKKGGFSAIKLFLIVVILLLIPTAMEQLSMHKETVQQVGRVCVGIAALLFVYGLIKKVARAAILILLILIGVRVLANEGVIDVPKLSELLASEE